MITAKNLKGKWIKQGNEFISDSKDFKLLLVTRNNAKPQQPTKYILGILPNGQRQYISGILSNGKIDYQNKYFSFTMDNPNEFDIA